MGIRNTIDYDCSNPKPFVPPAEGWRSALSDRLEVPAHLKALHASPSHLVLELACGDGRFTSLIAKTGAGILAVELQQIEGIQKHIVIVRLGVELIEIGQAVIPAVDRFPIDRY